MFVGTLIGEFVFALFIRWLSAYTATQRMLVGFGAWLGFIFPFSLGSNLDNVVQSGHSLVEMPVMGAVLGGWG